MQVSFPEWVPEEKLGFAVIAARYRGGWLFCRHRSRTTWELPGGHREPGESAEQAARRELYEETGALGYTLRPAGFYSVRKDGGEESFGALYAAEIERLGPLPPFEIAEVCRMEGEPPAWTYPAIQPQLLHRLRHKDFSLFSCHGASSVL